MGTAQACISPGRGRASTQAPSRTPNAEPPWSPTYCAVPLRLAIPDPPSPVLVVYGMVFAFATGMNDVCRGYTPLGFKYIEENRDVLCPKLGGVGDLTACVFTPNVGGVNLTVTADIVAVCARACSHPECGHVHPTPPPPLASRTRLTPLPATGSSITPRAVARTAV